MSAIGAAAGRDLDGWTVAWLDRAGTDVLRLDGNAISATSPGRRGATAAPDRRRLATPRPTTGSPWSARRRSRPRAPRPRVDLPDADLHLLNASDQTFAAVRPDAASVRVLLDRAADLPEAVDRAQAVVTGFQMLLDGELAAGDLFDCVLDVLNREKSPAVVEPFLNVALEIAQRWVPGDRISSIARAARRHRGRSRRRPGPDDPGPADARGVRVDPRAPRPARGGGGRRRRPGLAAGHPTGRPGEVRRG